MQSQGFGDSIAKFTKKTGIKTIVDKVSDGLNLPCGLHHSIPLMVLARQDAQFPLPESENTEFSTIFDFG